MNVNLISKVIYKQNKGGHGETFIVFDGELESVGVMCKNEAIEIANKSKVRLTTRYEK